MTNTWTVYIVFISYIITFIQLNIYNFPWNIIGIGYNPNKKATCKSGTKILSKTSTGTWLQQQVEIRFQELSNKLWLNCISLSVSIEQWHTWYKLTVQTLHGLTSSQCKRPTADILCDVMCFCGTVMVILLCQHALWMLLLMQECSWMTKSIAWLNLWPYLAAFSTTVIIFFHIDIFVSLLRLVNSSMPNNIPRN